MSATCSKYETDKILNQYLLFHYGNEQDQLPFSFGPQDSLNFPIRCVSESIEINSLPNVATALEIGCSVGRSCFELARHCKQVLGIDKSRTFIDAAKKIRDRGNLAYSICEEGEEKISRIARCPGGINPENVTFLCRDIFEFAQENSQSFDIVLAANILCRTQDPQAFLSILTELVKSKGQLILASPYSWLEEFTSKEKWLGYKSKRNSLEEIREILDKAFTLKKTFDLPFLIREHKRKYEWGVSQVSTWQRN